jgi:hypothetical protein
LRIPAALSHSVQVRQRILTIGLGGLAVLGGLLGAVYALVACASLPSFLGGVPGDTHPRTILGIIVLMVAVIAAVFAVLPARRGRG